jgi:hypothetical protein
MSANADGSGMLFDKNVPVKIWNAEGEVRDNRSLAACTLGNADNTLQLKLSQHLGLKYSLPERVVEIFFSNADIKFKFSPWGNSPSGGMLPKDTNLFGKINRQSSSSSAGVCDKPPALQTTDDLLASIRNATAGLPSSTVQQKLGQTRSRISGGSSSKSRKF